MAHAPSPIAVRTRDAGPGGPGRVGVVVVDWSAGGMLRQSLAALSRQETPPDRVVVVDNAGDRASWQQVRPGHPHIELVRLPENRGFAAGCNLGIALLDDCEWIALLNPDAFVEANWLREMLRAAETHSHFDSFASRLVSANDPDLLDGTGDVYSVSGLAWRRDHGARGAGLRLEPEEVFGASAAAALYRREALVEVGGLDESYFCYFEDVDLAFRLRLTGRRCLYVPGAVARHVGSATTRRHSDFSVYHAHRNIVWTFLKNMPMPLLVAYSVHHLLLNLLSLVHFGARGQARTILRAKRDALLGLPRVWRQRRAVQAARRCGAATLRRLMVGGARAFGLGRFPR